MTNPLPSIWGAVQSGHGSAGKAFDLCTSFAETAHWSLNLLLMNGKPAGEFVQKDSKGPFVYLLWGASAGQRGTEVRRRAKIYLPADLAEHPSWEVTFEGRMNDGLPICATVKDTVWTKT